MQAKFSKVSIYYKAARQLGWGAISPYLTYTLQCRLGILTRKTPLSSYPDAAKNAGHLQLPVYPLPNLGYFRALLGDRKQELLSQAEEIMHGQVSLFGGAPQPLELVPAGNLRHWTQHTGSQHQAQDIKFIWEPGRFGWAITLARAYLVSQNEDLARTFWTLSERFFQGSPPNQGPHWASGQEVALRLVALSFSSGIFLKSPHTTPTRIKLLKGAIASHAARILPTLAYARAQNNNHLITEAVGLYTAAAVLPEHPQAAKWKKEGWRWLHFGLQSQITPDGGYIQHSTNYHRLMLQAAMFAKRVALEQYDHFPEESCLRLAAASRWLLTLLDPTSGGVPNLGGNDGAYILPFTTYPYQDFRPVVQAACQAFLDQHPLPPGPGDEMSVWLGGKPLHTVPETPKPEVLKLSGNQSWGYLRAARFQHRPAHADQNHLDLWWRGHNITRDPGVYLYNGSPPWHNPLDISSVHNTLTIDQQEQMSKAGQFLWLDWAQAQVLDTSQDERGRLTWAVAQHNGYRKLKLIHRRTVSVEGDRWMVRDQVIPVKENGQPLPEREMRLHWLLPDWPWTFNNGVLRLDSGEGDVVIQVSGGNFRLDYSLVRAGEDLLEKMPSDPIRGWFSCTYGQKVAALSFAASLRVAPPFTLTTSFEFPG